MAAVGGNHITWFTYTGEGDIPHDATHVFVDAKIIPRRAFSLHNIVEVICHDKVEKIEQMAFFGCLRLRRVIMRGVKIIEGSAFNDCRALEDIECGKLEIIGDKAFYHCSLRNINLQSARIVGEWAFYRCFELMDVKFSNKLERFDQRAFRDCSSLERITIPLKDGMFTDDDIFSGCVKFKHVDLVEGALLRETIVALHMEDWRDDMSEEIDSINQILLTADDITAGEEANAIPNAIRTWIRSVLDKILHYQAEHQRILDEAAAALELALPRDIAMNNVLSFLELPSHAFGVEDREDAEDDDIGNEELAQEEEQHD